MFPRYSLALLAAATFSTAALADEPAKKDKDDPSRIVCRRTQELGSIMMKKVCHTAAEWAEIRKNSSTSVRRNDLDSTTHVPVGGV